VKTTFVSQESLNAIATMSAPMSGLVCSPSSPAILSTSTAQAGFVGFVGFAGLAIANTASNSTYAFSANGVVTEAAAANMTHVIGLACTPPAAKKHDRKYNWQLRPLSLCGESG
jgi:hypothetical protein